MHTRFTFLALALTTTLLSAKTPAGSPLAIMIAGQPSHGPGEHEHNAGVQLFAKCLAQGAPQIATKIHLNGEWPDATELAQADTIVIYADGAEKHPALPPERLAQLDKEMKRGCGFVCLHFAVEVPRESGGKPFLDWLGGYFEINWSVNPVWKASFSELPKHPIANGVKPFSTEDEWYFHMRFRDGMSGITPILSAVPPADVLKKSDGIRSGNPTVRQALAGREKQHMAWASQNTAGGRGFGFTGGHFHHGWGNDDQRKLVLNAILWTAKVEVPAQGVASKVSAEDLAANLDPKKARKPKAAAKPGSENSAALGIQDAK